MGLESTIICVDNSEFMRNGDYLPTRLQAQQVSIIYLASYLDIIIYFYLASYLNIHIYLPTRLFIFGRPFNISFCKLDSLDLRDLCHKPPKSLYILCY